MTVDELTAILRVHQGPFFHGTHSRCGCRRIVQTADQWARHVAEEQRAAVVKARTITTVEQLDALPRRSLVMSKVGDIWELLTTGWDCLSETGDGPVIPSSGVPLPARLLLNPEVDQ